MIKRVVMTLVVSLTMTTAMMAQEEQRANNSKARKMDATEMIQKRTDAVAKKYGLNDEQKKKLLELNTKYFSQAPLRMRRLGARNEENGKRPELTEEQKAKREERRSKMEESMKAYNTELQSIMTSDQYKKFQEDREKNKPSRPSQVQQ